jgi:hypothetical protein
MNREVAKNSATIGEKVTDMREATETTFWGRGKNEHNFGKRLPGSAGLSF